ncbi:MAG: ATP-binding protein [Bacteroidia bacterium]
MDIRKRLTIRFSLIVTALFVLFSLSVYFFSSLHRKSEFFTRMKNRGITIAQMLDNIKEIDPQLLKEIDKNTKNALYGEMLQVFDRKDHLIYSNATTDARRAPGADVLDKFNEKEYHFYLDDNEALGFVFPGKSAPYKVVVAAYDELGFNGLKSLRIILLLGGILAVSCSYVLGWSFSGSVLQPITRIMNDVDKITATELNLRLDEGKRQDELERLAITFNQMLDRIEKAFEAQKGFISNASHELRTPLTAMKGHMEVTLLRSRDPLEYKEVMSSLLLDIENLIKISNNLLGLAQATSGVGSLKLRQIRMDDLLFASRDELVSIHPSYSVGITMESIPEEEQFLSIMGNEPLMKSAFLNLLENGCKYADNSTVQVYFSFGKEEIILRFVNNGQGIPPAELAQIFEPFFRAANSEGKPGSGLGLALTQKIVELHKGRIAVQSKPGSDTSVSVYFPLSNPH